MRRSDPVAPFLLAAEQSVRPGPWRIADTGESLGGRVDHWDPDLTLRLDRVVTIDIEQLLSSTRTEDADGLALAATWRSDRTRLRGPGMSVSLAGLGGETGLSLSLDVPGHLSGGSLDLQTIVVRVLDGPGNDPIAAHRAGSVLWRDRLPVALEGEAARFPVTVIDFAEVPGLADDASWALEWSVADLKLPVLGAMRLLVNARNEAVVAAVRGDDDLRSLAIASMIRFDVARSLVHGALGDEEFIASPGDFESDSIGRMLCELLERYWPGDEPDLLARRARDTPQRLESELQAQVGLLTP